MHTVEMDSRIMHVLGDAARAPSGENAQPWRFSVKREGDAYIVNAYVVEERDQSLYGWGNRASYVALGAAVENMRLAASVQNMKATVSILPDHANELLAARVAISDGGVAADPLAVYINTRATNRKPYKPDPLTQGDEAALMSAMEPGHSLTLITDRSAVRELARIGSTNERIMLDNTLLHCFFFDHVNWSREEDEQKRVGFFIDTLELPLPARLGLRLMSSWPRARFLNRTVSMNTFVAKQNSAVYASGPAIGIINSNRESARSAIEAGISTERLWLTACARGLSIQPLTGVLYWALRIEHGMRDGFSSDESAAILNAIAKVRAIVGKPRGVFYFMFRIGHANPPSARSVRMPLNDIVSAAP